MERTISVILLVMVVSVLSNGADGRAKAGVTLSEIDRRLKLLNKPAVKSIESADGDIIDCVDIYKQPAFDHPAMKNHTIQLKPSIDLLTENWDRRPNSSRSVILQTWQKSGSCPNGTVPIRRIQRQDLLRAASLKEFGRKAPQIANRTNPKQSQFVSEEPKIQFTPTPNRSVSTRLAAGSFSSPEHYFVAAVLVTLGYNYIGASGDINLWNPYVDSTDDYTTAQIWLKGGPGDNFESIEGGWVVNPKLYGDKLTRLFIYWTRDSYKSSGCFDMICSGFVQTGQVALGATINPISSEFGPQYYLNVAISLDPNSGNWWLKIDHDKAVGYWPGNLFSYLSHSATLVEWGGQVYSPNVKKHPNHSKTAMGSGSFAHTLEGSACSIKQVRIIDYSLQVKYPEWVGTLADEDYCYDAFNFVQAYPAEPAFYFGGPGRNPNCN